MKHAKRITASLAALVAALAVLGAWLGLSNAPENESIPAAIVNLDEPVTIDGQMAPMGRQFAAELVRNQGAYNWEVTNAEKAQEGLEDGTYQAVVTVPATFSAAVTSIQDPAKAVTGQVDVQVRPGATIGQQALSEVVVDAAAAAIGKQLTQQFVGQTFDGFGKLKDGLASAADGAQQLSKGSETAAGGISQLAGGIDLLGDGVSQAADGANQTADGAKQLAVGADTAAAGVEQLAGSAGQLSAGTQQLSGGIAGLAEGTKAMADQTAGMDQQINQLVDGVKQYTDGVALAGQTIEPVQDGLPNFAQELGAAIQEMGTAYETEAPAVLGSSLDAFKLVTYTTKVCAADPQSDACTTLKPISQSLGASSAAALRLLGPTGPMATNMGKMQPLLEEDLAPLIEAAVTTGYMLNGNIPGHPEQAGLVESGQQLSGGLAEGMKQFPQLIDGIAQLNDGAQQLATASSDLADGQRQFATGASQAAGGVRELAGGVNQVADGNAQLADGLDQAAAGVAPLSEGAHAAADGVDKLGDGAKDLAKGLDSATSEIPNYSTAEVNTLSDVLSDPVQVKAQGVDKDAMGPGAAALILWLTTFFLAFAYQPFARHTVGSTRSAFALALSAWWRPAAWSAALGAVAGVVLGRWAQLDAGASWALVGTAVFVALTFATVQQALNAAFGVFGRLISLVIFIVASIPAAISQWLPPSAASNIFAGETIAGWPLRTGGFISLIIWAVLGFALTVWATSAKRANGRKTVAIAKV